MNFVGQEVLLLASPTWESVRYFYENNTTQLVLVLTSVVLKGRSIYLEGSYNSEFRRCKGLFKSEFKPNLIVPCTMYILYFRSRCDSDIVCAVRRDCTHRRKLDLAVIYRYRIQHPQKVWSEEKCLSPISSIQVLALYETASATVYCSSGIDTTFQSRVVFNCAEVFDAIVERDI
ncbi:hypothetical protein AUEXF2481DRAFT_362242 [Aureobasidium subglaciale EXF-2481]|uniref:Uncharacterized protein n=1 Tax=Aureobasidium subglaciale (strain EXF-2481) TaxID=1043005 RepID=A0A074Y4X1_AURSE|nr:uncharacterized protein AUEXF2481DRAFT_362242 [Aureobasidium subglaciale EXF-2481]KEQ92838.1 hypothetical protein AUEXF2481DRAFT_362242 [Aureobasidium subglaciale EXF-2481]